MKIFSIILLLSILSFHSQADCPLYLPYNNPDTGVCTKCPSGQSVDVYSANVGCVTQCPQGYPVTDEDTGWCTSCPDDTPKVQVQTTGGVTSYVCIACSDGQVYDKIFGDCVDACPEGTELVGQNCVAPAGGRCPVSNALYYDTASGFCVGSCPQLSAAPTAFECTPCNDGLNWNDTSPDPAMACVTDCPLDKPDNVTVARVCNACSDPNKPYWDNTATACINKCSIPTPANTSYNWCATCAEAENVNYWDPVNETCVLECPAQLPSNDENNTCIACNSTNQFWLNENKTCVTACPSWVIAHNEYKWCQNCTFENPLWNATNQTCGPCPAATPYWNNLTQTCVDACYNSDPNIPDFDENNWCQACNASYPYWNNTIHQCVNACPDTAPDINGSNWCQPCTNPTPVWLNDMTMCDETCPNYEPDTNDIGWCVPCNVTNPWYNSTAEECEACSNPTPYYNQDTYSCVSPCPAQKPYHDANNWCQYCPSTARYFDNVIAHDCVATCPRTTPLIDSNNWCQPCTNPTPYYFKNNGTCLSTCESPLPLVGSDNWCDPCPAATPYWDPSLTIPGCVATCSASVPLIDYRNVCIACAGSTQYWDPTPKTCVVSCPALRPSSTSSKVCQACNGSTKWNPLTSTCVEACPLTIPFVNSNNWCSVCPSGQHYNSPTATCISSCPNPTPDVDTNNWCQACPPGTPLWDPTGSGSCVATCPVLKPKTGQYNWCEVCPSSTYWNSISSSCVVTCLPPMPSINSVNWCEACPTAAPYWNAAAPASCVSSCPRQTPLVDDNKQCQACPSDKPYFDPDSSTCVAVCPPRKPAIGADNWCESCSSSDPYYFKYNATCVAFCPPITPSIDSNNWCQECSGATLKWNPLTSTCVAQCPESLPFWNANAIPRACEVGPDIGNVVDYLNTAGMTSTITLAGMQIAWPGTPYVALTILLINVLKYIRYLDINFPPNCMKLFQTDSLNIPSLNFGPLFPEDWKLGTYDHPAPERFARYDISGLFIANFWRGLTTAMIMAFGVSVMKFILTRKIENEKAVQVRDKAKVFLIWNYIFSFFISNIGNIVLFIFIEYRSLHLSDVLGTLSFVLTIVFGQISLAAVMYMIKCIKGVHKDKKKAVKETNPEAKETFKVLLLKYKDDHLQQALFIPIMCIRACLNAIFVAAIHAPVVQCSLLVVLNIVMLAYYIKNRPHRELVDNVQLLTFEITLLIADCACLHLATLPWEQQVEAETAGRVIIVCNVIMFTLSLIFILTRVIVAAVRLFKEKFAPKRPSNTVYVQTDVTGNESVVSSSPHSSQQLERKESKKASKLLSMSFESSAGFNIGTEEEQSPTMKDAHNFNRNNLGTFHVVNVPDDENEQMSKYFDTEK